MTNLEPQIYCTNEDLALAAQRDWPLLAGHSNSLADGVDGAILAINRSRLASAETDWVTTGIDTGDVVIIEGKPFKSKTLFGIESVTTDGVELRRLGKSGPQGPIGPDRDILGLRFDVRSLAGLIERASREVGRRVGIDLLVDGKRPNDLLDPTEMKEVTVRYSLHLAYVSAAYNVQNVTDRNSSYEDFFAKSKFWLDSYNQLIHDLRARFIKDGAQPQSNRHWGRYSR